jgi:hypothetical protein
MGSSFGRSRWPVYALPFILIITMSTAVGAQGLFGMGFPGASYLNGFWSGAVLGCGTPGWPGAGPTVYVGGSADYANGTIVLCINSRANGVNIFPAAKEKGRDIGQAI